MTTLELQRSVTFKNILVATDFSEASMHALEWAAAIADANEAQLFTAHAVPLEARLPVPLDPLPESLDLPFTDAKRKLETLSSAECLQHVQHEEIVQRGELLDVVLNIVRRQRIDLLVLGTHGRTGIKKLVLGSTAEELFRRALCPVLTVGPSALPARPVRRVLFATDFGPSSERALPYALDFANKRDGELILLHLIPPVPVEFVGPLWYPGNDLLERQQESKKKAMERLRGLLPPGLGLSCNVERAVEVHLPPEGIIDFAEQRNVDLIVMGVKESSGTAPRIAAHMPWAIAYAVVCQAECPVLTIRA
jgi:nucleotide-binding universal stress UspA family protein